jgi:hypothetical protein
LSLTIPQFSCFLLALQLRQAGCLLLSHPKFMGYSLGRRFAPRLRNLFIFHETLSKVSFSIPYLLLYLLVLCCVRLFFGSSDLCLASEAWASEK